MTPEWYLLHGGPESLGLLPQFFLLDDPRPAAEQINERYAHGGGWSPFKGFEAVIIGDPRGWRITYPGDPPYFALAFCELRNEIVILFQREWLMVVQEDGTWQITRVD